MVGGNWTEIENGTTTAFPDSADPANQPEHANSWKFFFVVLSVGLIFILLSTMIYVTIKKKRLDQLRHHLVPLYNFDPGECEDWEAELLEEADQNSQKKIQDYKSMSSPRATSDH